MSFSRGLKEKAKKVWEAGYYHPFVQELGQGILDKEQFQFYLLQDYHYLLTYAKVFALGTLKAEDEEVMFQFTKTQMGVLQELELHREYMRQFGVCEEQIQNTKPALFNQTYTANMLAVGQVGGIAEILAAVFPCAWTYADYGQRLVRDYQDCLEGNYFRSWIENYASKEFEDSFQWFYPVLDKACEGKSDRELIRIEEIFQNSVEFEYLFWEMAYFKQMSYWKE